MNNHKHTLTATVGFVLAKGTKSKNYKLSYEFAMDN